MTLEATMGMFGARALLAAIAMVALIGCSDSDTGSSDPGPPPIPTPVPPPDPPDPPANDCPTTWPTRVPTTTDNPDEVEYLDDIVVCSAGGSGKVLVTNTSDLVWAFFGDGSADATTTDRSSRFRELVDLGAAYESAYMAPEESVVLASATGDVSSMFWEIHRDLTALYLAEEIIEGQITKYATDAAISVLAQGSKGRMAAATCALAAWNAGTSYASVDDPNDALASAFSTAAGAGGCATAWKDAEVSLGRTRFPPLVDGVESAGRFGAQVGFAEDVLSYLRRACVVLRC